MKYTIFLSFLLVGMIACSTDGAKQDPVVLSGAVENAKAEIITLSWDTMNYDLSLNEDGSFSDTLELDQGYYTFTHGRERTSIYLTPGDDLKVSLDTKKFDESLSWEGTGANVNNYLAQKFMLEESMSGSFKDLYSQDEEAFVAEMNQKQATMDSLLKATTDLPEAFVSVESNNIKYQFIADMYDYEGAHRYFSGDSEFEASDAFNAKFESLDYGSDELYKTVPSYKDLLMYKYVYNEDKLESATALSEVGSSAIKDDMLSMMLQMLGPGVENLKETIDKMKAVTSNEEMLSELDTKYENLKNLERGNASPGFNFEDINGAMVDLQDLKGKNVYIDVWATWCGPCKREIPFLKTLEGDYHDENIEFVSISVDTPKDKQKWLDMVADKELKGIQLISDNGWSTSFVEEYLINGIPRFILLDAEGNIVSANAPRPSSGKKIREMIDGLEVL